MLEVLKKLALLLLKLPVFNTSIHQLMQNIGIIFKHYGCPNSNRTARLQLEKYLMKQI